MMKYLAPITLLLVLLCFGCTSSTEADLLVLNGVVATMDTTNPKAEAIAVKNGRIVEVGSSETIKKLKGSDTRVIDANGAFVMPGFIEGHGHFSMLGKNKINLDFLKTQSWEEVVAMVKEKAATLPPGEWIEGRGWHQEKWTKAPDHQYNGYPYHDDLSAATPDHPVILKHTSGHSTFVNKKAMEAAGISVETPDPVGGKIVRDQQGKAIGVFEERAQDPLWAAFSEYQSQKNENQVIEDWYKAIDLAQEECLSKGITSFQDAGSSFEEIDRYRKLAEEKKLRLRLWVMVRHSYEVMKDRLGDFPMIDIGDHFFSSRAIKTEVDGALGSFGAWLLKPYDDKANFVGQNTTEISEIQRIAGLATQHDMQLCVHAIGDRANREVLNIMENLTEGLTDHRWRIEHAQHLDTSDIPRFSELGIIASIQGIHCTSDAPFVVKRLGIDRAAHGAYAWRSLLDSGAKIANGTDAPVEDVNPLESLYASVTRKRADTGMEFFTEQKMTREEALYSYTLWNAYAGFEEKDKGSLEVGKLADLVILSNNLLECDAEDILKTKVLYTIVDGKIQYQR